MKKCIALVVAFIFLILTLVGCSSKYNAEDFIGKTSAEIIIQYGSFDCITMPADNGDLYRNCQCGYTIKEQQAGFLGASPEILFFIIFDENGIATECTEGYRPGG